jgi:hypothetical protein
MRKDHEHYQPTTLCTGEHDWNDTAVAMLEKASCGLERRMSIVLWVGTNIGVLAVLPLSERQGSGEACHVNRV